MESNTLCGGLHHTATSLRAIALLLQPYMSGATCDKKMLHAGKYAQLWHEASHTQTSYKSTAVAPLG